jgi:hypothetical protein
MLLEKFWKFMLENKSRFKIHNVLNEFHDWKPSNPLKHSFLKVKCHIRVMKVPKKCLSSFERLLNTNLVITWVVIWENGPGATIWTWSNIIWKTLYYLQHHHLPQTRLSQQPTWLQKHRQKVTGRKKCPTTILEDRTQVRHLEVRSRRFLRLVRQISIGQKCRTVSASHLIYSQLRDRTSNNPI